MIMYQYNFVLSTFTSSFRGNFSHLKRSFKTLYSLRKIQSASRVPRKLILRVRTAKWQMSIQIGSCFGMSYVFSPHTLGKLLNNNINDKIICIFLHFVLSHMKKPWFVIG